MSLLLTLVCCSALGSPTAEANPLTFERTFKEEPGLSKLADQAVRQFENVGASYRATSPSQRYQTKFSPNGAVTISPAKSSFSVNVASIGFGAASQKTTAPTVSTGKDAAGWPKLTYSRPELSEWYVNEKGAMHHWLQVPNRPKTAVGNLWVKMSVSGADELRTVSDTAVEVRTDSQKLTYRDLKVWDADYKPVRARLEVSGQSIYFNVQDAGARYPITIDPTWTQEGKLVASDGVTNDFLGFSVAVDGDYAIAGAYFADPGGQANAGAAYVFKRTSGTWAQEAKLTADTPAGGAQFGWAVDIEGDRAIVGAFAASPGGVTEAGLAYVFSRSGNAWTQQSVLAAPDAELVDRFGYSVAIDGSIAVVGAYLENPGGVNNAGSAYVFRESSGTWAFEAKLSASNRAASDQFGLSVDVLGSRIAVGANLADTGVSNGGSAYIYDFRSPNWEEAATLVSSDVVTGDSFGRSVALGSDQCIVGANNSDPSGFSNAGAAYVFQYTTPAWSQEAKLVAPAPSDGALFGFDVAISGSTAVVGAYFADPEGFSDAGAAYVFTESSNVWTLDATVTASDKAGGDRFGYSVSIDGGTILVGAPNANIGTQTDAGAAYAFLASVATINSSVSFPVLGIPGSKSTTGTVNLASAVSADTPVSLSSNLSSLIVPASVTVFAGQNFATFPVTSTTVTTDTLGTVTATGTGISSSQGNLTIRTPRVGKIVYNKSSLIYGQTAIGTVSLQAVAPAGGIEVTLTYDTAGVISGPSSVMIPAGTTTKTFTVTAQSVGSAIVVKTEAFPSFNEKSASITVSPLTFGISSVDSVLLQGQATTGKVLLANPAPVGGLTFNLSASQSRFVVPTNVFVPESATEVTFPITAGPLPVASGFVTASIAGLSESTAMSIIEMDIQSIALSPSTVSAGAPTTATVTLISVSPVDTVVSLSLQKPTLASVPASIIIPAGMLTGTFSLTTYAGKTGVFSVYGRIGTKGTKGTKITIN